MASQHADHTDIYYDASSRDYFMVKVEEDGILAMPLGGITSLGFDTIERGHLLERFLDPETNLELRRIRDAKGD